MSLYTIEERVTMKNNHTGEKRPATRTVVARYNESRPDVKPEIVSDTTRLDRKPEWEQVKT